MLNYLLFLIGFFVLIKGADLLVDGASAIARRLRVSDLVIGLTVVAFGTSTPELFVNVMASAQGNTEIAIGNVLGSNVANVLLILGIAAIICPLKVSEGTVLKEIPLSLLAAVVLGLMANDRWIDGADASSLSRIDGLVFLAFFTIFLSYSFHIARRGDESETTAATRPNRLPRSLLQIVTGLVGLTLGARWIVEGAVALAQAFGLSESVIGLTIVAIGTSLPELATSAVAAWRRNLDIAVGNVVGSNIFNIFFVLGVSAAIRPLPFQTRSNLDIGAVLLSSLLLFLAMFTGKRRSLDRWEGVIFLLLYVGYIGWTVLTA